MDPKLSQFVTLQGPWPPKRGRVLAQNEGAPPKKSRTLQLYCQMKNHIFSTPGPSRCKKEACAHQK